MYIFRLDDASEYMDTERWGAVEALLDRCGVKPLVGVIPENRDPMFSERYERDCAFWQRVLSWRDKGWSVALHGCDHVYVTDCGGMNPVHKRSEFAGLPLETQRTKVRRGLELLRVHGLDPEVFFAPGHTFDENTLEALRLESDIRIISDTVANDVYYENGFWFVPQQTGRVRELPFATTTVCLHPNSMSDADVEELERFLTANAGRIASFADIELKKRKKSAYDRALSAAYFIKRGGSV